MNKNNKIIKFIGIIAFLWGNGFWLLVYLMPFFPFELKTKLILSGILAVTGEILFWLGTFILGKGVFKRVYKYISERIKKRRAERTLPK